MTGSENLWSEDDLLTQMEQMQDQIDRYREEKDDLIREMKEKEDRLLELEQTRSSEILKLQSALQQAQKKLQEQSDQIVKLSSADLILKDNEKLKEENARLRSGKEQSEREAARVEEACKARLQRKDREVQKKIREVEEAKAEVKEKEEKADELIRDREELISKEVSEREKKILKKQKEDNGEFMQFIADMLNKAEKRARQKTVAISTFALAVTILYVSSSGAYRTALRAAGVQAGSAIVFLWTVLLGLAKAAAGITARIPVPILKSIVYWAILIVIIVVCCVLILAALYFLFRKTWSVFIKKTNWPVFLILGGIMTMTALFGGQIQKICPVNVVYADLILWLISCVCWAVF